MSRRAANPHLGHARHNEKACDFLYTNNTFYDWTVTIAFYAALHYVTHKIFPLACTTTTNKRTEVCNVEAYIRFTGLKDKKHRVLADLVNDNHPNIGADYAQLLDMSYVARYENARHDKRMADKARSLMENIRDHCCRC